MNPYAGTIFFVPRSNFTSGMGSCLAIGGNYYQHDLSPSNRLGDYSALSSDWKAVGQDLNSAMHANPLAPTFGGKDRDRDWRF